jgi:hypothetical protein
MVAPQEEFKARVNLLMSSKVGDLHHVQDRQPCNLFNPWLGNNLGLLPHHLHQVPMWCKHHIFLSVSKVEITNLEIWDQSQLRSNCVYPLREVNSDMCVLKVTRDVVMNNYASQMWDVFGKDQRDLFRIRQIVMVLGYFLSRGSR